MVRLALRRKDSPVSRLDAPQFVGLALGPFQWKVSQRKSTNSNESARVFRLVHSPKVRVHPLPRVADVGVPVARRVASSQHPGRHLYGKFRQIRPADKADAF
eukprot:GHVT01028674.1.p2 GENE.GHVT01028674.1~~GHVT01028674.1.p2  ORF type:complete len:102 (+),score=10.35 GHVT01028674.1:434-739(+)